MLKTIGAGSITISGVGATATIDGATIVESSFVAVRGNGAILTLSGGTNDIDKGAVVRADGGGTLLVSGTVINDGKLIAGHNGTVEITSGAIVSGGVTVVDNGGTVVIDGSSKENVTFASGGSGTLVVADSASSASAYSGTVTSFGGQNGENTTQDIVLGGVAYAPGEISASYSGTTTSGTLTVSSGGTAVAEIKLDGHYTFANFVLGAVASGTYAGDVEIVDPPAAPANGTSANLALFGNYIATSFVTKTDINGGSVVTDTVQGNDPPHLANPHHG